ncbi:ADP-ribosylglycohydrolase family protein [Microbacterium sp. NPDC057407]|uniref:ADP-ribosylglycohydrolase family protein n=1 Tax=Microbacterium sp. NPDC057407 TaxID=3346120 RepID=UPI00366B8DAB
MFPPFHVLRRQIAQLIADSNERGREVGGLMADLNATPDDYSALFSLATRVDNTPTRAGWEHYEPSDWAEIAGERSVEHDADREVDVEEASEKARAGFLGSVAGCILGKPVEIMADLEELKAALQSIGEWPLNDYIPQTIKSVGGLRSLHPDWPECVRENIDSVAPDDDINYTLLGAMLLEKHGISFTKAHLRRLWLDNLPLGFTWGPERGFLTQQGMHMALDDEPDMDLEAMPLHLNPNSELCGAMIRADAYGYAAAGRPALASELAWRDASMTHTGNGIYGSMFAAAAIATAFVTSDWREITETALGCVPQRTRFATIVRDSIDRVAAADDWESAYSDIHGRYSQYGHCRVFQETGTLVNTLRFAQNVGHGVCIQVSQGNDTDSYGATVGAILGVKFGPGHLEDRWLTPFKNTIRTRLSGWWEPSLSATADRISKLPRITARP